MAIKRMDNVLIVVDDLEAAKTFFIELGLKLEGESTVEGPLVGSLIGLKDVRATLAMLRTPDGQGIELDKFHTPNAIRFGPVDAPVNTLGFRRVMFAVDDIDAVVARMLSHGAELIGEMRYEDTYRLAYIRGPEGIMPSNSAKADAGGITRVLPGASWRGRALTSCLASVVIRRLSLSGAWPLAATPSRCVRAFLALPS
jgi:catechol 2,3-dioxygenase-like lactoylglutathione lyase family enzyme